MLRVWRARRVGLLMLFHNEAGQTHAARDAIALAAAEGMILEILRLSPAAAPPASWPLLPSLPRHATPVRGLVDVPRALVACLLRIGA